MPELDMLKVFKGFVNWRNVCAFVCTLTISLCFNCTWRTPREGFRYGGLQYFIALTVANVFVALPASFLHLALGQLVQDDIVRIWRAVPFFRGIGYLRLLTSYIGSICTTAYLAIFIFYFMATATTPRILYPGCTNSTSYDENANVTEMLGCIKEAFIEREGTQQHFWINMSIIFIVTIIFAVIFYWIPVIIECFSYVLGPVVIIMCIIIASTIGDRRGFDTFNIESNWSKLLESDIWRSALTQALLSSQLCGGYLILCGASLYPCLDTQWTALFIVGTNILTSLAGLMFWFGISGEYKDTSVYGVLIQVYLTTEENGYPKTYPMLISAMLILSGAISMLTFLSPTYDFMRRISVEKWKAVGTLSAYLGGWIALTLIQFGPHGLTTLEYIVVPCVTNFGIICEILAFLFFYGLKSLVRDVEFLIGKKLPLYWPFGWWVALLFTIVINMWWMAKVHLWLESRWEAGGLIGAAILSTMIFLVVAKLSVDRQVQVDIREKLKSSLRPSRKWGPRHLLTNLYWKTYCRQIEDSKSKSRSRSRSRSRSISRLSRTRPGQSSFHPSALSVIPEEEISEEVEVKVEMNVTGRSYSDGVLYSAYRKEYMSKRLNNEVYVRPRSMSLDMNLNTVRDLDLNRRLKEIADETSNYSTSDESIVHVKRSNVVAVIETHE